MGSAVTTKTEKYVFSGIWSFCVFSFSTAYMSTGNYWVFFIPDAKT
jgi:hypothetical protein